MKLPIYFFVFIPVFGWATVSDFNDLIKQNNLAQQELHQNLQGSSPANRKTVQAKGQNKAQALDLGQASYNAPTDKMILKFKKELKQHRVSNKKEMDRLANEFKSLERNL